MNQVIAIYGFSLALFFAVTFSFTWWIRGRGFGELLGLVRPPLTRRGGDGAAGARADRGKD